MSEPTNYLKSVNLLRFQLLTLKKVSYPLKTVAASCIQTLFQLRTHVPILNIYFLELLINIGI